MDFQLLTTPGNIAFYNSCEVTEIFLSRKSDKAIFNLFTMVVFEEKPYAGFNQIFLGNRIPLNKDFSIGIQRYWLTLSEAEARFETLKNENRWSSGGEIYSRFPQLRYLPKQYVPATDGHRLNHVLKNNFHNGSYIIEFFDEVKSNLDSLFKIETLEKFNEICEKIKTHFPVDLSVVRERIGNFIFQFPVTSIEVNTKALPTWDGVSINFAWHHLYSTVPECLIQVESTLDKNYMGGVIAEYNRTENQIINIGNLDQTTHIKIWRKEPSLILTSFNGSYLRDISINMQIINPEPRLFEIDGKTETVQVSSDTRNGKKKKKDQYATYITNTLYDAEKKQLERVLSFKQYKNGVPNAINDLRALIQRKDENGVYLWDPFLTSTDILNTLYYSKTAGVPLRAIGSINDTVKKVYHKKGKSPKDIIIEYKAILDNPRHNNFQLDLEFRIQHTNHGWAFHDRFLIFPGDDLKRAQVYSLGTSVNSYGQQHHILQEVSHTQPVVDAFNELWNKLNNSDCLVWKHPK